MLKGPTVLVLGAGSSADFNLPVGSGLAADIVNRLGFYYDAGTLTRGDGIIAQELQSRFQSEFRKYLIAARDISNGLPSFKSIDDYLYTHSEDECAMTVGKMAIVASIGHFERNSTLAPLWKHDEEQYHQALGNLRRSWVHTLIQVLVTGTRRLERDNLFQDLSVVTFNYDRCLETALYHGIQAPLRVDGPEAARVLDGLRIYRPYGGLGPLLQEGAGAVPYGPDPHVAARVGDRIRVYTEALEERPDLKEMRQRLAEAEQVIFLGFGFHRQNMELLDIDERKKMGGRQVLATCYLETLTARTAFNERIRAALGPHIKPTIPLPANDCQAVMREHAITFSA